MMNNIYDVGINDCTGCGACAIICPYNAITMKMMKNGFIEPEITLSKCLYCGICKEVCYKYLDNNISSNNNYSTVYAVLNNYFEQIDSVSTIGIATQIAKYHYSNGNIVAGVTYDVESNSCKHTIANCQNDLELFKGSKYLQSANYETFKSVIDSEKKSVVFGTPCQIYGLKKVAELLGKSEQILFVDFFCAGIPSYNLWKKYIEHLKDNFFLKNFMKVNFRDKTNGWHKFSMKIIDSQGKIYRQNIFNDLFYSFYLKKTCLNKACYNCLFRHKIFYSDIRLGDFWGEKYNSYDDGVGLVVINSKAGEKLWENIKQNFRYQKCSFDDVYKSQKIQKMKIPKDYNEIMKSLETNMSLYEINLKYKINERSYSYKDIIDESKI